MLLAYEPMEMTGLKHITQEISAAGASLKKTSGTHGSFDSTASSSEYIESLQSFRRGLRCKLSTVSRCRHFFIGLTSSPAGLEQQHPKHAVMRESVDPFKSITYTAGIYGNSFYVYESGKQMGQRLTTVQAGDTIEIRLTNEEVPKVEYRLNDKTIYTSSKRTAGQAPLFAKICAFEQSPLVEGLQWILEPGFVEGEVALTGFHGVSLYQHTKGLSKVDYLPGNAFNATVRSKDAIEDLSSTHVGICFVVSQREPASDQSFAVGFTRDPDRDPSLESLAHAAHIRGSSFKVYENGVLKGEIHHHVKAEDRIDMIVVIDDESSQPKIQFYANRQLRGEIYSNVHFPLYAKVCARSQGALIEGLRWINRSQHQAACLRHVTSPASSHDDDPGSKMQELEMTMSGLLSEVGALKEEMRSLKAAAEEHRQLQEAARVEKADLERQLDLMKAEIAAEREASRAAIEEKSLRLAELQAERDSSHTTCEVSTDVCTGSQGLARCSPTQQEEVPCLRPMADKLGDRPEEPVNNIVEHQIQPEVAENLHLSPVQLDSSEEELLAVMVAKAKLEVREMRLRRVVCEANQKAQLEEQLKAVTVQNERLQRQHAENGELHCLVKQMGEAFQRFNTNAVSRSSESGSDPWELLGSDGPASSAAADES